MGLQRLKCWVTCHRVGIAVARFVEGWHVEARLRREPLEQLPSRRGPPRWGRAEAEDGLHQRSDQRLTLADAADVEEVGDRLRVDRDRGAAHHNQGVLLRPDGAAPRNPGELEHGQQVGIVVLEGGGERQDVRIADRSLALETHQGRTTAPVDLELVGIRQEGALAADVGMAIEEPIDRLQAEVAHPHPIGVGVGENDPQASPLIGLDEAGFGLGPALKALFEVHSHEQRITRKQGIRIY